MEKGLDRGRHPATAVDVTGDWCHFFRPFSIQVDIPYICNRGTNNTNTYHRDVNIGRNRMAAVHTMLWESVDHYGECVDSLCKGVVPDHHHLYGVVGCEDMGL